MSVCMWMCSLRVSHVVCRVLSCPLYVPPCPPRPLHPVAHPMSVCGAHNPSPPSTHPTQTQVCLTNQIRDLLEADRVRIAGGGSPLYLVSQYTYGLAGELKAFKAGALSFALPVT